MRTCADKPDLICTTRHSTAAHNGTYVRYSALQVTAHNAGYGRLIQTVREGGAGGMK